MTFVDANGKRHFMTVLAARPLVPVDEETEARDERAALIASARAGFIVEKASKTVLCSERAWVNDALRQMGQETLSTGEKRRYQLDDDERASRGSSSYDDED